MTFSAPLRSCHEAASTAWFVALKARIPQVRMSR